MSGAVQQQVAGNPEEISNRRVWFEFAASAASWLFLGCLESVIAWRACVHQEQFGGPSPHPVRAFFISCCGSRYSASRHWPASCPTALGGRLCGTSNLLRAEGRERKEFMSLSGLFISITLGIGFLWMCLPLFMLQMCARTR